MEETVADGKCMTREDENYIFQQSENITRAVKDEHIEDWRLCLCFLYSLQNLTSLLERTLLCPRAIILLLW